MGSSLDSRIAVTVLTGAAPVTEREFRLGLYGSNTISFSGGDLYRIYETLPEVEADTDVTGQSLVAAQKFFAQEKHPPRFMIGAVALDVGGGELADSLTDILEQQDFYHLELETKVKAQIVLAAAWVEANKGQGWFQSSDADFLAGTVGNVSETLQAAGYTRSHVTYHETDTDELAVGLAANFFWTDPDVGATTAADQTSIGSNADDISSTEKGNVTDDGGNVFLPFGSTNVMYPGQMANGGWIDFILTKDWLENRSQIALIQAILDKVAMGSKVPYTDKGTAYLEGKAGGVMLIGVSSEQLQEGTWSVTGTKVAELPDGTRVTRAYAFTGQAFTAGAIQEVNYTIYLQEG